MANRLSGPIRPSGRKSVQSVPNKGVAKKVRENKKNEADARNLLTPPSRRKCARLGPVETRKKG